MVIYVVARNPFMRTARNVFIVNLAISDLMLCLITMPLTLVEILYVTWQFGEFGEVGRHRGGLFPKILYPPLNQVQGEIFIWAGNPQASQTETFLLPG